jgi:hypothetical protein
MAAPFIFFAALFSFRCAQGLWLRRLLTYYQTEQKDFDKKSPLKFNFS